MNEEKAISILWDYMHMNHKISKADALFLPGHHDLRVPEYAAKLYKQDLAPIVICSGSGSIHVEAGHEYVSELQGMTEAQAFKKVLIKNGVPDEKILIEDKAQNTGQNYEFTKSILEKNGISLNKVIAVQKPYMERRVFATGKIWWPDVELLVTSPKMSFDEYVSGVFSRKHIIEGLVGDFQRVVEYPKLGFQVEQDVPNEAMNAFNYLIQKGYTRRLLS